MHEIRLIQLPQVDDSLLPVLDVDHRPPDVWVPAAVALIDLPAADEVQTKLVRRECEVRAVPREVVIVHVGELLHQHPHLLRAVGQRNGGDLLAIFLDGVPGEDGRI